MPIIINEGLYLLIIDLHWTPRAFLFLFVQKCEQVLKNMDKLSVGGKIRNYLLANPIIMLYFHFFFVVVVVDIINSLFIY